MQKFDIMIHSRQEVQEFVSLAAQQPFRVTVGNDSQSIDGKDFMGMFSLDYDLPVQVRADCTEEECRQFMAKAARFLA